MPATLREKSTVDQIRQRFDGDVERFSKLETGQQAAMDALLILDLVSRMAASHLKAQDRLLDLGCGAGNFTLRVLERVAPLDCTLVDLSRPMLDRAESRIRAAQPGHIQAIQSDMRSLVFSNNAFDVILAGQVLHHLRDENDWKSMFTRIHNWLRPGGMLLVADFTTFDNPVVQSLMMSRYAEHLEKLGGPEYRDKVLNYCDLEDSPRSITFQFTLLKDIGFNDFEVLHRNGLFAAYYARK